MGNRQSHHSRQERVVQLSKTQESVESACSPIDDDDAGWAVVCAMDFGTSNSGYAFSFNEGENRESNSIFINKNWGENVGARSYKTPTTVLTGPDDEFVAFGYEAEEEYGHLDESERKEYHLYKHFKMSLKNEVITKNIELEAIDGYKMKALTIFSFAIKYLKDHLLDALTKQAKSDPDVSMIRWVITVPAIWSLFSKQFMREAAFQAGCITEKYSRNLVVALEPEAASICCRDLPVNTFKTHQTGGRVYFEEGTENIIVDAGGGTTDITVHRITNSDSMGEIFSPSGGAWGSTQIDRAFQELLGKLLGENFINVLMSEHSCDWLGLMRKFEKAKKSFGGKNQRGMAVEMSYNTITTYNKSHQTTMEEVIGSNKSLGVSMANGHLQISYETCLDLMKPVILKIVEHVESLLKNKSLQRVSSLLLVGGLGTSSLLKSELEQRVSQHNIRVIVPHEAELAVLKGAVMFGRNVKAISSRIMKHTYGVDMEPRFKPWIHKASKKVTRDGTDYCEDVFQEYVKSGESKNVDEIITKKFFPRVQNQQSMTFDIFYTDKTQLDEVEYIDNGDFIRAGGITVMMPKLQGGMKREVEVQFCCGGTEIAVRAKDVASGELAETTVNMLLD